jgi:hypothetical protein
MTCTTKSEIASQSALAMTGGRASLRGASFRAEAISVHINMICKISVEIASQKALAMTYHSFIENC